MTDLLDRLRKRQNPGLSLVTMPGNLNAAAACAVLPGVQSGTFTIGGADADIVEAIAEIERLAEATKLTREIHEMLKRGPTTQDHGLIGNLECILDHFSPDIDPMAEPPTPATKRQRQRLIQTAIALAHRLCPNPTVAQVDDCYEALRRVENDAERKAR
jgi:hypothetical protein